MPDRRPNILLLFTDQQRADTVAALGNPQIRTPALDRLCREGTAFTRCYTPSPVCVPARAALATGLPSHLNGCFDNNTSVRGDLPSVMEHVRAAGYQTHGVGKMHFTPDLDRLWGFDTRDYSEELVNSRDDYRTMLRDVGFGHVEDPHGVRSEYYYIPQPSQLPAHLHHTSWVADRSIDFLQRRDNVRPFFLMASFIKPHPPFEAPTPWNKLYRTPEMVPPFRPDGFEVLLTYWNRVQNRYKYRDHGYDELLVRTIRAAYYACISFIDAQVGRILDALGTDLDNTLVLFSSDHGELLGDYGSFGKRSMLDAAARVPMLARLPGRFAAGAVCDTPTSLLDVMPTCLACAEVDRLIYPHAADLASVANGAHTGRFVTSQYQHRGYGLYMAAWRSLKYVYSQPDAREWLFDRDADPCESRDVSCDSAYADRLNACRAALIERLHSDGFDEPLNGDAWRATKQRTMPTDPDAGLIYQDAPGLQDRINALGPYARDMPRQVPESRQVFHPQYDDE